MKPEISAWLLSLQPVADQVVLEQRDDHGQWRHPGLPWEREPVGVPMDDVFDFLGYELGITQPRDEVATVAQWWESIPTPIQARPGDGGGWCLVAVFDAEDGPRAWWLRPLEDDDLASGQSAVTVEQFIAAILQPPEPEPSRTLLLDFWPEFGWYGTLQREAPAEPADARPSWDLCYGRTFAALLADLASPNFVTVPEGEPIDDSLAAIIKKEREVEATRREALRAAVGHLEAVGDMRSSAALKAAFPEAFPEVGP